MKKIEKIIALIRNDIEAESLIEFLLSLEDRALLLEALEMNGINNWEWYDESCCDYLKWKLKNINVEDL